MIDPKKVGYMYLAQLGPRVQTAYNFFIMEANLKTNNRNKLVRINDLLADNYMIERCGDKKPFTMEDKMTELMNTFSINSKWLADHPEGSNAFDIESAATLYTIYQVLDDIFELGMKPAAAMSTDILTQHTIVTPALDTKHLE